MIYIIVVFTCILTIFDFVNSHGFTVINVFPMGNKHVIFIFPNFACGAIPCTNQSFIYCWIVVVIIVTRNKYKSHHQNDG